MKGRDVLVDVVPVALDGAPAAGVLLEVAVEQLVDRGRGLRVAPLPDVREEPLPDLLGPIPRLRAGRDDLDEVVPALRHRVLPGVDPHAKGSAGELIDGALL